MRQVGTLPDAAAAQLFVDWLTVQGISAEREADGPLWVIWVHEEDQQRQAMEELQRFVASPQEPQYRDAGRQAEAIRRQEQGRNQRLRQNQVDMSRRWGRAGAPGQPGGGLRAGPFTLGILGLCLGVSLLTNFGVDQTSPVLAAFHFSDRGWLSELQAAMSRDPTAAVNLQRAGELAEKFQTATIWDGVRSGQVWRLVTPIFLHFSILHLLFNGWMFLDFGSQIEREKGGLYLLLLVLGTGVASNLVQAAGDTLWNGPLVVQNGGFGGLSGVVYATVGFVWMRARYVFEPGFVIRKETVILALIWLAFCIYSNFSADASRTHYANGAHVGGLLAGMLWGYWPRLWR